jgi:uncharacterized protein with PQ loop repeat
MKDNVDNYLDDLAKKVIKGMPNETPAFNFTNAVMSKVFELSINKSTIYKPPISKTTWVLVSIVFLAVIIYTLSFGTQTESSSWLSKIDFSVLSMKEVSLPSFKISKTSMYSFVLFGIMICIQIPFLKHHFNKQFEN